MSSSQYPTPKRSATASDRPRRNSSNSYCGGDPFDTPSLQSKRTPPQPQPAARTTQSPSNAPKASDSVRNVPSAFQPLRRGQTRHPPQNRSTSVAVQQEQPSSRTRQLNRTSIFLNNDAIRDIQTKSAPTLHFSGATVSPIGFKHAITSSPSPPPPPKPRTPVVNLDDDAVTTSAPPPREKLPQPQRNPPSSPHFCHPYADDLPRVPKKEGNPPRNSNLLADTVLNPTRTNNRYNPRLRSQPLPDRRAQQTRHFDAEPINVEDDPRPASTLKPKQKSLTSQQPVSLTSRSPSPPPKPNPTIKQQQPNENSKFTRRRTRPISSQPLQPPHFGKRRSVRLRDKHTPDGICSEAAQPHANGFSTAPRCSPDVPDIPRSVGTKRPRVITPSSNDSLVTVVKTRTAKRAKKRIMLLYDDITYDHDYALSLLRSGSLWDIRLSFMGITNGDLQRVLDFCAGMPDIPEGGRNIQFNNNRLCRITADMFERLRHMKVESLVLTSNQLTYIDQSIVMCRELKILDLAGNDLKGLPEQIGDLSNLTCLRVSDNKLTKLPPALYLLRKLKILSVARNNLESFPEDITEARNSLTALDISGNQGFHCFPVCCKNWDRLEDLILTGTEIFVYLTKKERKMRAKLLIEELAGKPLEKLKNRTRRRRTSVYNKEALDVS